MPPPSPRVAVIVPVRNRRALLAELLDALATQTYRDFEVVVVDDQSDDGSAEEARRRGARVVASQGAGAYAARRTGVAASTAPYLAFTDSDCRPVPRWLELGVAALDGGADLVNGGTWPARPPRPLERTMASGEEGLYPTCNVFYRREAYLRAGGFDDRAADRFGFRAGTRARRMGFGEDTLLAWQVRRAGGRAAYRAEALVEHHVFGPDLADSLRRTWMMVAFPALLREVPEIDRPPLVHHGLRLGPRSRLPVYATAAAVAVGRRRLAAAGLAWWVAARARDLRAMAGTRGEKLAALPVELAMDAVTAAALVVGSARHRHLVL
jgi:Glycosyl transferase family 2